MGKGSGSGDGKGLGVGKGSGKGSGDGSGEYKGKSERVAVPAMPMPMAVICCVLNFVFPGLGTMVAGFSNFCCARNEDMDTGSRMGSCCVSVGIGCLQLLTTLLCFIGWGWSCVWGVFFIGMSCKTSQPSICGCDSRNGVDDIYDHCRPRSACASAQSDQALHCSLTLMSSTAEYYHNNRVADTDGRRGMVITNQQVIITQPGSAVTNVAVIHQPTVPQYGQPVQPNMYGQPLAPGQAPIYAPGQAQIYGQPPPPYSSG